MYQRRFIGERCNTCEYNSCTLSWCVANCTVPLVVLNDIEREHQKLLVKEESGNDMQSSRI